MGGGGGDSAQGEHFLKDTTAANQEIFGFKGSLITIPINIQTINNVIVLLQFAI